MATSSIFTEFKISKLSDAEKFADAILQSEKNQKPVNSNPNFRAVTNPDEIKKMFADFGKNK